MDAARRAEPLRAACAAAIAAPGGRGFILAALGLVCCCCGQIFSVVAIILGAIAYGKGDHRGMWVIIAGAISFLITSGLGASYVLMPHMWPHQFRHPDWMNGPWRAT